VEKAKQAMLRLIETQRALMAHSRALDEMQMQYQHPGNAEETNFAALMEAATDRHLSEGWATYDPAKPRFLAMMASITVIIYANCSYYMMSAIRQLQISLHKYCRYSKITLHGYCRFSTTACS